MQTPLLLDPRVDLAAVDAGGPIEMWCTHPERKALLGLNFGRHIRVMYADRL